MKRLAVALCTLCACAGRERRVDFKEPLVVSAGRPAELPLGELDDETLFVTANKAFERGDLPQAALRFDRLWTSFPASPRRLPALWNAALAHERMAHWQEAFERFTRYAAASDTADAQLHAAVAEYHLGRRKEAAARLHAVAATATGRPRAEALLQEGVIHVEGGDRATGSRLLREALATLDGMDEPVDPALLAQAEYWLAEALRADFQATRLDPAHMDEATLAAALEAKAQMLLAAQSQYLRCARRGDPDWATAAGTRIGALYEELHDALVDAPPPPGLTPAQSKLYGDELRARVRRLLEKALRAYDETLALAGRTATKGVAVEKARESVERLRALLAGQD